MSSERPTLADVIAVAIYADAEGVDPEEQAQVTQDAAAAVREHILGLLADETLVERCADDLFSDPDASVREDVLAVLAQVAEAVRDER